MVRGTVRRMKLGKSITLTLQSGKSVTFDDEDIVTIELFGGGAGPEAGTSAASEASTAAPSTVAPSAAAPSAAAPSKAAAAPAADSGEFPTQSVTASAAPSGKSISGQTNAPSIAPLPAPSPVSDLDTVFLNDGGLIRGTIESEKPDVVIKLISGRKRTIASRDVKSIARHGAAPADPNDAVFLKDGTVLRGVIETDKPDVVIRLASGKKRTVPAASVQRIERAKKP